MKYKVIVNYEVTDKVYSSLVVARDTAIALILNTKDEIKNIYIGKSDMAHVTIISNDSLYDILNEKTHLTNS